MGKEILEVSYATDKLDLTEIYMIIHFLPTNPQIFSEIITLYPAKQASTNTKEFTLILQHVAVQ